MDDWLNQTHLGDCRALLGAMAADGVKVQTCVTSPPYFGLRDYGHAGQIGLEPTPDEYLDQMVAVFRAVRDVLADDGTLWLNLGDSYAGYHGNKNAGYTDAPSNKGGYFEGQRQSTANRNGIKAKDLIGIPWRVAFALQADGWYLRCDIIWHKPNPMPESVTDRPTKAHEYLFLLAKSERYYYDAAAIKEPGIYAGPNRRQKSPHAAMTTEEQRSLMRNKRSVWTVSTKPQPEAHFACFPPDLIEPCILAGAPAGGIVLDPFIGSGTTARVALSLGRQFIGCELNPAYTVIQKKIGLQGGLAV